MLTFEIAYYGCECIQKRWKDKEKLRLEDQLNAIVAGIFTIAEAKRVKSLEKAEEEVRQLEARRSREEHERLRLEEEARIKALESAAESWVKSRNVREFLEAYKILIASDSSIGRDRPEAEWLAWALRHADRIDPIANGTVDTLIREFHGEGKNK